MKDFFVNSLRGNTVETKHKIHAIILQGHDVLLCFGNDQIIIPMRSSAKPFMVCKQLELCREAGIDLSDAQISLMVSSHNGENEHRDIVESILKLSDSTYDDLFCGTHLPFYDWLFDDFFNEKDLKKRQLFHNCSGKHAGMLLLSKLIKSSKHGYWKAEHPVQQLITSSVKDLINISRKDPFSLALDGCGVPTYCITLHKMAEAYQHLYKDDRLSPVLSAVLREPYMIAGKGRVETEIIHHCGFFAKSGSDGIFCIAIPEKDISIALKVEDGNDDAAESAIIELLAIAGLISPEKARLFDKYRYLKIYTSTGLIAGMLDPENCI